MKAEHRIGWHPKGGWCRKFPGDNKRTYFGKVTAPAAIKAMHAEEERRKRGEAPELKRQDLTVKDAANLFLNHQDSEFAKGEIKAVQRARYGDAINRFIDYAGKTRRLSDFCQIDAPETIFRPLRAVTMKRGLYAAVKFITQIRTFMSWCSDTRRLMPPPFYADEFAPPSKKERRAVAKTDKRAKGTATWSTSDVREIVDAAKSDVHRFAQILLMINGGFGSTDLSNLDDSEVNFAQATIDTDRSETMVPRLVPLWDITAEAMKASRAARAEAASPEHATRFFLTPKGIPLVCERLADEKRLKFLRVDTLRNWFHKLVNPPQRKKPSRKAKHLPHSKRHRAGVYTLRSVFATLAAGHGLDRNLDAIILGHKFDRAILEHYLRGEVTDKLRAIVEHVRWQIWPECITCEVK